MQPADPHPHMTLFLTLWAAIGPMVGIVVGHLLTRSWQREQWILDSRKEEFRELLSTLTMTYSLLVQRICTTESTAKASAVIRDRLYIAVEVEELKILERWKRIESLSNSPPLLNAVDGPFRDLTTDIVIEALKMPRRRFIPFFKRGR
jgi:hypothetical protein